MARARSLTPLGAAIAQRDAQLRSAWERDYAGALDDAKGGQDRALDRPAARA
jgi:hypothetical protein